MGAQSIDMHLHNGMMVGTDFTLHEIVHNKTIIQTKWNMFLEHF